MRTLKICSLRDFQSTAHWYKLSSLYCNADLLNSFLLFTWNLCPVNNLSPTPHPHFLVTNVLFPTSRSSAFLYSTFKQAHVVCVSLCLAYFTQHNVFQVIHVVTSGKISFYFKTSSVPVCVYSTISLSTRPVRDTGLIPYLDYCE